MYELFVRWTVFENKSTELSLNFIRYWLHWMNKAKIKIGQNVDCSTQYIDIRSVVPDERHAGKRNR
jgi:hypothetical protein